MTKIEEEAREGRFFYSPGVNLSEDFKIKLKELGYYVITDCGDYEEPYTAISWK